MGTNDVSRAAPARHEFGRPPAALSSDYRRTHQSGQTSGANVFGVISSPRSHGSEDVRAGPVFESDDA